MPCDCELDLTRQLVKAWAWGTVTHAEATANRLKFSTHPEFRPDFNQIYDTLGVTGIAVSTIELGLLARDNVFGLGSRRAFIGPRIDTVGFLRTFQLYRQINGAKEQIRLFSTMEAAEAWIAG
jgi:hypothetical protein